MGTWSVSPVQRVTEPCSAFLPSFRRTPPSPQPAGADRDTTAAQPCPAPQPAAAKPLLPGETRSSAASDAVQAVPRGRRSPGPGPDRNSSHSPSPPCRPFRAAGAARDCELARFPALYGPVAGFQHARGCLVVSSSPTIQRALYPRRNRHRAGHGANPPPKPSPANQPVHCTSDPARSRGGRSMRARRPYRAATQQRSQTRFQPRFWPGFHVSWFVPVSAGHSVSTPEWCKSCQYDLRHIPDLGFCENPALERKTNHPPIFLRFRRPVFD